MRWIELLFSNLSRSKYLSMTLILHYVVEVPNFVIQMLQLYFCKLRIQCIYSTCIYACVHVFQNFCDMVHTIFSCDNLHEFICWGTDLPTCAKCKVTHSNSEQHIIFYNYLWYYIHMLCCQPIYYLLIFFIILITTLLFVHSMCK